jgi:hypothetical protein
VDGYVVGGKLADERVSQVIVGCRSGMTTVGQHTAGAPASESEAAAAAAAAAAALWIVLTVLCVDGPTSRCVSAAATAAVLNKSVAAALPKRGGKLLVVDGDMVGGKLADERVSRVLVGCGCGDATAGQTTAAAL